MRTQSGLGNGNQQPLPRVIKRTPEVADTPEPMTTTRVQEMIWAMMARQMEEMRQMLRNYRDDPTMPIVQPELNEGQSEEGNYSQTVSQTEPKVVRKNQPNGGNDGCGCK